MTRKCQLFVLVALVQILSCRREAPAPVDLPAPPKPPIKTVVVNEAVRTLLYLPLYRAQDAGCFSRANLSVQIVTGGTAAASFTAMTTGHAQFSQADPMYVPIARERGTTDARVVAQVVGRIAVWGVSRDKSIRSLDRNTLKGKVISTHKRPMTAYAYAVKVVQELGLTPGKDVKILENQPGTELAPLFRGEADIAFTLEPQVSQAEANGAHVIISLPDRYGDQIFTALMTTSSVLARDPEMVAATVRCYQEALLELHSDPAKGVATAIRMFPTVERPLLTRAVQRLIDDDVIPTSVLVSEESWNKAVQVRLDQGDLTQPASRSSNADVDLMLRVAGGRP